MIHRIALTGLLAGACLIPAAAWAADPHDHAGDIAVSVVGGQLTLGGGYHLTLDGSKLYEATFGDQFVYYQTSNPGFQTQDGATLQPGSFLTFAGTGTLQYWNGAAWTAAAAGDYVSVRDAASQETRWTGSGVQAGSSSFVAKVDASGNVHSHLTFSTNPVGTEGAYLLTMQLGSTAHAASTPFLVAFNYGLSEENFEMAVDSLVTAVPEPGTYALMLAGLAAIGAMARRRRSH
ncbi:MAG: PEP-CTERM sorting domain-containing protein [Aquincola sp.]|uniref:PEP-CTERM sorting domain-containing protein n=1 Tax=uncultured Aquincola sp. TaxID=886556 RepID=UPI0032B1A2A1|nr:PEP-CTERM sorting domain-containing protein [Aquincola sp.]|tara:strand:- start:1097 stop:1798 length:702 start_codon:yes stop_codon:yes gene_type:complete